MKKYMILFSLVILSAHSAWAKNSFLDSLNKKYEGTKTTRWTIADWLETKKKINLMDQWLAANTKESNFEAYLEGAQLEGDDTDGVAGDTSSIYGIKLIYSVVGLKYQMLSQEKSDLKDQRVDLSIRLLGASERNTNLQINYGVDQFKNLVAGESTQISHWGASLKLYIFDFLGFEGSLQNFLPTKTSTEIEIKGSESAYGVFLEVSFIELYYSMVRTRFSFSDDSTSNSDGSQYGLRLCF